MATAADATTAAAGVKLDVLAGVLADGSETET
jgi:hypothetical protein